MKSLRELCEAFADYRPSRRGFTTSAEADGITEHFGLVYMDLADLQALRDTVVDFFGDKYEETYIAGDIKAAFGFNEAMMSITAVIDHFKYNINPSTI